MMKYLALALLLCALPSLSDASCYRRRIRPDMTHCQDLEDGTWHAVGSNWRNSQCMDCTCDGCCTTFGIPRQFPDDCVPVFDPEECVFIVHKRDDPTILCPVFGSVLK